MENQNIENQQKISENIANEQANAQNSEVEADESVSVEENEVEAAENVTNEENAEAVNEEIATEENVVETAEEMSEQAEEQHQPDGQQSSDVKPVEESPAAEPIVAPVPDLTHESVSEPEEEFKPEKKKKKAAVAKAEDFDLEPEDDDDDISSFFRTIRWKRIKDKISLALLLLVILVPVGLLAYIILKFFL